MKRKSPGIPFLRSEATAYNLSVKLMFFFLSFPFLCSAIEKTSPNRKRSSFVLVASLPSVGINHIKFKGLAFHPLSCISTPSFLLYFLDYSIFFLNGKYFFSQLGKLRGKHLSLFTKISKKLKIILLYFFRKMTTLKKVQLYLNCQ